MNQQITGIGRRSAAVMLAGLIAIIVSLLSAGGTVTRAAVPAAHSAVSIQDNTLVRDTSTGRTYLVWSNTKHWITSQAAFDALGLSTSDIHAYATTDLSTVPDGNTLNANLVSGGLVWPLSPITAGSLTVTLSQPTVAPGGQLPVSASGFNAGEQVAVYTPSVQFTVFADGGGNVQFSAPVPTSETIGYHHIWLVGSVSHLLGGELFYVASPPQAQATAPAAAVAPGGVAQISGTGFAVSEQVRVFLGKGESSVVVHSDGSGNFAQAALPIPAGEPTGVISVLVFGAASHRYATTSVTVTPGAAPTVTPISIAPPAVNASLTVTPNTVAAGSQVAVSGSGFVSGDLVLIRFNGTLLGSVPADAFGNFGAFIFGIPAGTPPGTYGISAAGSVSGRNASGTLSVSVAAPAVTSAISVSPSTVVRGNTVSVAGTGFQPGESISIFFGNGVVGGTVADGSGSFNNEIFTVPGNIAAGVYTVQALGATGRVVSTQLTVTNAPAVPVAVLSLNPSQIAPRGTVHFAGGGYNAGEYVQITVNAQPVVYVAAGANGAISGTFAGPAVNGTFTVAAVGTNSRRSASAVLHVSPIVVTGISLSTSRTERGKTVSVSGNNYGAREVVLVYLRGSLIQAGQTDGNGHFSGLKFSVPGNTPYGSAQVSVVGARTNRSAKATFSVVAAPPAGARLHVSSGTVHRGDRLTISGSGFQGGEVILIRFRGALVQAAAANSHGDFSKAYVTVPLNMPYGKQSVTAQGSRSGRSVTVKVTVAPKATGKLTVSPIVAPRGGVVRISGSGFHASERVLLSFRGALIGAPETDKHGAFSGVVFRIPAGTPTGYQKITSLGTASNLKPFTEIRIVTSVGIGISVSPSRLQRGQSASLSGYGYGSGEVILVYLDGKLVQAGRADGNGNFYGLRFTVPANTGGADAVIQVNGATSGRHSQLLVRLS